MVRTVIGPICALALLIATPAVAQEIVTGTVRYVDESAGVIVFEDGRAIQTTSETVVLVESPRADLAAVQPGTRVMVIANEPVAPNDDVRGDRGGHRAPSALPTSSGFTAPRSGTQEMETQAP